MSLDGKRVLVTGGATGIGLGITKALVHAGAQVVVTGRRPAPLKEIANTLGVRTVPWDITREQGSLIEIVGELDHLVNNAGSAAHAPLGEWTAADFEAQYRVHVVGPALLSQAFVAQAARGSSIVNIASTLAVRSAPGTAAYSAAKAAMVQLTRSLALELAPKGIRANALLPGVVPTALVGDRADDLLVLHPLGRLGTPADIASAVRWLLEADWVTGAAIPVDGGLLTRE